MKSTIRKQTFQAMYRLLDKVSPIDGDCGKLCGCACCSVEGDDFEVMEADAFGDDNFEEDDFELGMYLLPGEEKIFTQKEDWLTWSADDAEMYDFPESWHGKVYFIRCNTPPHCERKMRPLQCRTFPAAPHIDRDGELSLIRSTQDTPYVCPLIAEHRTLNDRFLRATFTVWKHLIKDPLIYDLVLQDSQDRIEEELPLELLYMEL